MNTLNYDIYKRDERKNQAISALITAMLMLGLYASLRLLWLHYPDPPPPPVIEEIEILLGTPDGGMNSDYAEIASSENPATAVPEESSITQDVGENAPVMTPSTTPSVNPTPNPSPVRGFNMSGRDNNGGIGTGGNPGNQGDPNGSPTGDPGGVVGGTRQGLGNRKTKQVYRGQTNCKENGVVMIEFTVNRDGKVTNTKAVLKNSTITDPVCHREAEANAKKWVFEADPDAPEFQKGVLPVHFKVE